MTAPGPLDPARPDERFRWIPSVVAGTCALAINGALLWFLVRMPMPERMEAEPTALQVVWITRTTLEEPVLPEPRPVRRRAARRPVRRPTPSPSIRVVEPAPTAHPSPAVVDERWARPVAPSPPGDAGRRFEPDPFAGRAAPLTAHQDRMDIRVRDRSIGGRLQEMTRRGICGDLRKALGVPTASAAAILASMQRHDCDG